MGIKVTKDEAGPADVREVLRLNSYGLTEAQLGALLNVEHVMPLLVAMQDEIEVDNNAGQPLYFLNGGF